MPRPISILLVEDDDPLRRCLVEVLASRGFAVHHTGVGQEAVEMALKLRVDFSILDLHLRGMTGIQVLEMFARLGRPLPSIMMSGQASQEETAAAMSAGVFTFLRKPLDLKHLLSSVELLIRQRLGDASFPPQPHP